MTTEQKKHIDSLIEKAAKAGDSSDAMRFSQAACNAANAASVMDFKHKEN